MNGGAVRDSAERATVNAAGLVQGIALVTFPVASGIFTSGSDYGLSSTQYGLMFAPQVAAAIAAASRAWCTPSRTPRSSGCDRSSTKTT